MQIYCQRAGGGGILCRHAHSLFAQLSTTTTTLYKVRREQDSKTQRMTLTAALDNTNTIYTVCF